MIDTSKQLCIQGQTTIELFAWLSSQAESKLPLEHENGAFEEGPVHEDFEHEWGTDLVGHVGHTDVKERQLVLENIADENFELVVEGCALDTLLQLGNHPRVDFAGDHFLDLFQDFDGHVASAWTDFQHRVCRSESSLVYSTKCRWKCELREVSFRRASLSD